MGKIIIVKRTHLTNREYWPRFTQELVAGHGAHWNPDSSFGYEEKRNPKELGKRGLVLYDGLVAIQGIGSFSLDPRHIEISLREGYTWKETEGPVVKVIEKALGWRSSKLVRFSDWMAQFGENEAEMVEQDQMEEILEEKRPLFSRQDQRKEAGIVIDYLPENRVRYWPPRRIADRSADIETPLTSLNEEDKKALSRVGGKGRQLVEEAASIDGVRGIYIDPYCLTVQTSPAFNTIRIQRKVLSIVKRVCKLLQEEKD